MAIDQLPPDVRLKIVTAKAEAMRLGSAAVAPDLVAYSKREAVEPAVKCHLLMAAAELSFLDGDLEAALSALTMDAADLSRLPRALKIIMVDNRMTAQLLRPRDIDWDSDRVNRDEKEVLARASDFSRVLVDAWRAARAGKHFDALPQLRSYIVQAYWSGDWRLFRDAASELSTELLALGELRKAVYCAMLARSEDSATAVGMACLNRTHASAIREALTLLIERGTLRQHAKVVCAFAKASADAVPDDMVDSVADYLLRWVHSDRVAASAVNTGPIAWEALGRLGTRVKSETADHALAAATADPEWQERSGVHRQVVVRASSSLVAHASEDSLRRFTNDVLPLATAQRRGHDYEDVLQLLWRIAMRSAHAKNEIVSRLFSAEGEAAPASLMQLAKLLGKELRRSEDLNAFAERLAQRIRAQVTVVQPDGQAPIAEGFGVFTFSQRGKQVAVQFSNLGPSLEGLWRYRDALTDEAIASLVDAMAEMVAASENVLTNRAELAHYIGRFAEGVSANQARHLVGRLEPIARGAIVDVASEGTGSPTNPLNRFKFNLGTPENLQGVAIVALAKLDKSHPGLMTGTVQNVVASGLAHTSSEVRKLAYVAATWLSEMSAAIVTGLLLGTRDAARDAAAVAFSAFSSGHVSSLPTAQADYLVQAIHAASLDDAGVLRAGAAGAVRRLGDAKLTEGQTAILEEVAARLRVDHLHSVRQSLVDVDSDA